MHRRVSLADNALVRVDLQVDLVLNDAGSKIGDPDTGGKLCPQGVREPPETAKGGKGDPCTAQELTSLHDCSPINGV